MMSRSRRASLSRGASRAARPRQLRLHGARRPAPGAPHRVGPADRRGRADALRRERYRGAHDLRSGTGAGTVDHEAAVVPGPDLSPPRRPAALLGRRRLRHERQHQRLRAHHGRGAALLHAGHRGRRGGRPAHRPRGRPVPDGVQRRLVADPERAGGACRLADRLEQRGDRTHRRPGRARGARRAAGHLPVDRRRDGLLPSKHRAVALAVARPAAGLRDPRGRLIGAPQHRRIMQDWAASGGGYYEYVRSAGTIERAFDRMAAWLRRPADYGLVLEFSEEPPPPAEPGSAERRQRPDRCA